VLNGRMEHEAQGSAKFVTGESLNYFRNKKVLDFIWVFVIVVIMCVYEPCVVSHLAAVLPVK